MNYMQYNNNRYQNYSCNQQRYRGQQSGGQTCGGKQNDCSCRPTPPPNVNDCGCRPTPKPNVNDCGCRPTPPPNVNDCGCRPMPKPVVPTPQNTDCMECVYKEDRLQGMPLAMAYVPWQRYKDLYNCSEALCCGTVFKQLDLPFCGRRCN